MGEQSGLDTRLAATAGVALDAEREPLPDDFASLSRPTLYFGISRPIGTHTGAIKGRLITDLEEAKYLVKEIKLSRLISSAYTQITGNTLPATETAGDRNFSSYRGLMRAGDALRMIDRAMVAKLAVMEINKRRGEVVQEAALSNARMGVAYIITHLMHPSEVETLRAVYGQRFFLVAASASRSSRREYLATGFEAELKNPDKPSRVRTDLGIPEPTEETDSAIAQRLSRELISIDAGIRSSIQNLSPKHRLNVDDTFQAADLFVESRAESLNGRGATPHDIIDTKAQREISRFLGQIFSNPFGTPTADESAMATAFLAARSSVSLGRSVGAALVDLSGAVIATGWNEVAKPGGGPYVEGDDPDHRDHVNGFDTSDISRVDAIRSFLRILLDPSAWKETLPTISDDYPEAAEWLSKLAEFLPGEGLTPTAPMIAGLAGIESFDNTRLMHLIEFGRSVHAEMAALSDAFRRGVGSARSSIFVTTFPCHECARNLISFGVTKVVYVEPYGKSMAESLYGGEIEVFPTYPNDEKVKYVPYSGISPRRLDALFSPVSRKIGFSDRSGSQDLGSAVRWYLRDGIVRPVFMDHPPRGSNSEDVIKDLEVARLRTEVLVAAEAIAILREAISRIPFADDSSQN